MGKVRPSIIRRKISLKTARQILTKYTRSCADITLFFAFSGDKVFPLRALTLSS